MLHADFERILKPVNERCRNMLKQCKNKPERVELYTEKINRNASSKWCVDIKFS